MDILALPFIRPLYSNIPSLECPRGRMAVYRDIDRYIYKSMLIPIRDSRFTCIIDHCSNATIQI